MAQYGSARHLRRGSTGLASGRHSKVLHIVTHWFYTPLLMSPTRHNSLRSAGEEHKRRPSPHQPSLVRRPSSRFHPIQQIRPGGLAGFSLQGPFAGEYVSKPQRAHRIEQTDAVAHVQIG